MEWWEQRRRELRHVGGLRLPEDEARRWASANRSAHRSERPAFRTTDAVESAGLARPARGLAGNSLRTCAVICGTDLSSGRAESDAGVAPGSARAPRPAGVRANLRVGNGGSFWRSGLIHQCLGNGWGHNFGGGGAKGFRKPRAPLRTRAAPDR